MYDLVEWFIDLEAVVGDKDEEEEEELGRFFSNLLYTVVYS